MTYRILSCGILQCHVTNLICEAVPVEGVETREHVEALGEQSGVTHTALGVGFHCHTPAPLGQSSRCV